MEMTVINKRNRIHPQKFALLASMASIVMMFGALTSAYIVKQAAGNWLEFSMPMLFYASTFVILSSSFTLNKAWHSLNKTDKDGFIRWLWTGVILAVTFVVLQYYGWLALFEKGVDLKGNVSGSFFYLLTGIHALHVLGGIAALVIVIFKVYFTKFPITENRVHKFDMVVTYWHFVDALWVYLFLFLLFYK